jgi:dienelactone hydrolase
MSTYAFRRRSAGPCLALAWTLSTVGAGAGFAGDAPKIAVRRTPDKVLFGVIGDRGKTPRPTLFVFAHGLEVMRREPVYTEAARMLSARGWLGIVVEPPCHGEDVRRGEPPQLAGWRYRLEHDDDLASAFTARARTVLNFLVKEGSADPKRVAVYGVSRGGFLAFHFAASEPRVKAVGAISPVTRLLALREFHGTSRPEKVKQLDLVRLAPKLAGRAVWLSIGNNDGRVNTDDSIAFTRAVVAATARPEVPDLIIPVDLLVGPTAGHTKIERAHELFVEWLSRRIPAP